MKDEDIKVFIEEMFPYFDLNKILNKKVEKVVLGKRRALISVLAFIGLPEILIFDEPTVGMDQ